MSAHGEIEPVQMPGVSGSAFFIETYRPSKAARFEFALDLLHAGLLSDFDIIKIMQVYPTQKIDFKILAAGGAIRRYL